MSPAFARRTSALFFAILLVVLIDARAAQQPPAQVSRTDLLKQVLPPGDYKNVQVSVVEIAPGGAAQTHRHDVAVVAYVIEGEVENQFDAGSPQVHRVGESWWEAPGTVHRVARNTSTTARARLLVVYIGEEGRPLSVPVPR